MADPPPAAVAARPALMSIAAFWLFYFAIVSLRATVMGFEAQSELLWRRALVTVASAGITLLLWRLLRPAIDRPIARTVASAALLSIPAALLYSALSYLAFAPLQPHAPRIGAPAGVNSVQVGDDHGRPFALEPVKILADNAVNGYFFFATWAALYLALHYAAAAAAVERRAARFEAAAQSAELRALRYQVNPHFLFNTLNSLSTLVMTDRRDEAERMILNLSTFFRTSLTGDPTEDVPLADEIALQRLYLDIEAVRFRDRLAVMVTVPAALGTARVPGLILQPLLENAIKYGVSPARRPVAVSIAAGEADGRLRLVVEDDGDPLAVPPGGSGIGLANVRDRLRARFGETAAASWGPRAGGGFRVELAMPLVRHG